MSPPPVIVWFRRDLRLADNPALANAAADGRPVVPLFILEAGRAPADFRRPGQGLDQDQAHDRALGAASAWWLHHSLAALGDALAARGLTLLLRRGLAGPVLDQVIAETGATALHWNRRYDPAGLATDRAVKADLEARGLAVRSFQASLLVEPWAMTTRGGTPFRVFTAFWKACRPNLPGRAPLPQPPSLRPALVSPASDALEGWALAPRQPDWAAGFAERWQPGEAGARANLAGFLAATGGLRGYGGGRDRPDLDQTSRLSPHLAWGEISPAQIWWALDFAGETATAGPGEFAPADSEKFRAELGWREFNHHLLFHNPDLHRANVKPAFDRVDWRADPAGLAAWQQGRTGYPLVDAGLRQLWRTGWMHNRVRMVVASFLAKHLLIDWRAGEAWFWDCLVDACPANNPAGWQWVAGSGADAAPYFRIFNPVLQSRRFDPEGAYLRRWLPELAALPARYLHAPWEAPAEVRRAAGVELGRTYPDPLVDHGAARARALAAFAATKDA